MVKPARITSGGTTVSSPHILVLGHVTRDIIGGVERLGGAASFASRAASALGYRTTLVTAAPSHALLQPLLEDSRIIVHGKNCSDFTTFVLDYSKPQRRLYLRSQAPPLLPDDIPMAVRKPQVAYIAPVMGECGNAVVDSVEADYLVVSAQGWMRQVAEEGLVIPYPIPESRVPRKSDVVVFSELDCPAPEAVARRLGSHVSVVAITRAAKGVTLFCAGEEIDLPAEPACSEVDPTGAGEVFGVVLGLSLYAGMELADAARRAMWAAARVIEGPEMGNLTEDAWSRETCEKPTC